MTPRAETPSAVRPIQQPPTSVPPTPGGAAVAPPVRAVTVRDVLLLRDGRLRLRLACTGSTHGVADLTIVAGARRLRRAHVRLVGACQRAVDLRLGRGALRRLRRWASVRVLVRGAGVAEESVTAPVRRQFRARRA